jgi:uncharacterized protein YhaN
VRVERVEVEAFGGLRDFDTGPGPLPGFVVLEGPNEAGKSSFFEMLVALLYGFYPASRDRNPWAPWNGGVAAGSARLRLDDGTCLEVRRRLLSAPAGSVVRQGHERALRNETLAQAAHVPQGIYRQVFALRLEELATLEADGWDAVQDRLLGALGARDLRPVSRVIEELETEAGTLWRQNRRGNQAVRALDERIRELAYRRTEVRENERALRDAHTELAGLRARLDDLKGRRDALRTRLERARTLDPILRQLTRIGQLEREAGPAETLADLPEDPLERLERLRQEEAGRQTELARLEATARELERVVGSFGPDDRLRAEQRGAIEGLAGRMAAADPDRVRLGQLEQEIRDLQRRLASTLEPIAGPTPPDEPAVRGINAVEVRRAVDTLLASREERAALGGRAAGMAPGLEGHGRFAGHIGGWLLALAFVGLAALGVGGVWGSQVLIVIGTALVAVGAGILLAAWLRAPAGRSANEAEIAASEARVTRDQGALEAVLDGFVPVPETTAALAGLPTTLDRAQELARDLEDRREERGRVVERLQAVERAVTDMAERLEVTTPGADEPATVTLHALRTAVRESEARGAEAERARTELAALERRRTALVAELESLTPDLDALTARLARLGDGDPDRGAQVGRVRLEARRRATDLAAELDRGHDDEHVRMAREHLASGGGERLDTLARLEVERQALGDEIDELHGRIPRLEATIERLSRRETLDALDGERLVLEERRARLARDRDRLWVLARIVREAERTVREEHQPELLRRAGSLLATLTEGRYDRIVLDGDGGRSFRVLGPAVPHSVPVVSPLSTGTREQIYLALRLALLDALDGGGERLPLVLDEVLVNWDARRRDRGLDALARLAEHRQIFLLTCHGPLARAAADRGALVLPIAGP